MQAASYDPAIIKNTFFTIYITHLATKQTIDFRGWVTEFSDQFTSTWNTETVYGRMDPLATFQNTQRQISLGFDVVSGDAEQAVQNLARINKLISFLYPVYESSDRDIQNTLKAAPLLGMRWTNLIADSTNGTQLIGFLAGASYNPDMNQGGFISSQTYEETYSGDSTHGKGDDKIPTKWIADRSGKKGTYIPKVVSLSLDFTVLHKHLVGWAKDKESYHFNKPGAGLFPNANSVSVPGTTTDTISESDGKKSRTNKIQRSAESDILKGSGGFGDLSGGK